MVQEAMRGGASRIFRLKMGWRHAAACQFSVGVIRCRVVQPSIGTILNSQPNLECYSRRDFIDSAARVGTKGFLIVGSTGGSSAFAADRRRSFALATFVEVLNSLFSS